MKNIKFIIFLLLVGYGIDLNAQPSISICPASPYPVEITQPDNSKLWVVGKGNILSNHVETEDGYTLIKNSKGIYEYAVLKRERLIPSGRRPINTREHTSLENNFLNTVSKHLENQASNSGNSPTNLNTNTPGINLGFPASGTRNVLVLLIKYPDLDDTYSDINFNNLMNEPNYNGTGSFKDYFLKVSKNALDLETDVFGWYTAANNFLYYGRDNGYNVSRELVGEAIDAAEASGVDFSIYDNDNDGYVDGVIIVHSGSGAEEGSQTQYVWSHKWSLGSTYGRTYDGVTLNDYMINPETRNYGMVGIGIISHEFGHGLGLPDLYDIDDSNGDSEGIGNWGLMGGAAWLNQEKTPAFMCAWSRAKLNWVTPISITFGTYSLDPSTYSSGEVYKIGTGQPNEYFLLENRQKSGQDTYLPGEGLAIWHIDDNQLTNGDENHKKVDLEEADGSNDLDNEVNRGDDGDLFPGSSNNSLFNNSSNPNSNLYSSVQSTIKVNNISENGLIVSFDVSVTINQIDSLALVALYNSTDGPNWSNNTNWLVGPVGSWYGVTTANLSVTEIALYNNNLSGSIPVELGNVLSLSNLDLSANQLTGGIPTELGSLSNLVDLLLDHNQLTGTIPPSLGNMSNLGQLSLWVNQLTGNIPAELGNLSNLTVLWLDQNQLTGPIPLELGNLANLLSLWLDQNQLTGTIPRELGSLANLLQLVLGQNQLTGSIPVELGNLSDLYYLNLEGNQLTGSIPFEFGNLSNLNYLYLSYNQLTGSIPIELGNLTNLFRLWLNSNQLTGNVPTELSNLPNLNWLTLSNNKFTGSIPVEFGNLSNLDYLLLYNNQLSNLPDLTSLTNLIDFPVYSNNFTFEDIELNVSISGIIYSPQNQIPGPGLMDLIIGDELNISIPVGGSANQFQWVKDGLDILGAINDNLVVPNVTDVNGGTYYLRITNSIVPGLTLRSEDIVVTVSPCTPIQWYIDADGDSYGDSNNSQTSCDQPSGYVDNNLDCNDSDASINPDTDWYADTDGDGFGDPNNSQSSCIKPDAFVADNTDCDDTNDDIYPGASALPDGKDNNCDGTIDKIQQTITFSPLEDVDDGSSTIELGASSSSMLPVTYSIDGSAIIDGRTLTLSGPGTIIVTASQAGDEGFLPAMNVVQIFCVNPAPNIYITAGDALGVMLTSNYNVGNQWYLGNEAINDAKNQTYLAHQNGFYKVEVTIDGCIGFSGLVDIVLTAIPVESLNYVLNIYPVPVNNILNIETEDLPIGEYTLRILDVSGKTQINRSISVNGLIRHHEVEVQSLSQGIYTVFMHHGDDVFIQKILKE